MRKFLVSGIILALILAGIVFAQENPEVKEDVQVTAKDLEVLEPKILPGNPLYFLKDWVRGIQLAFTFNKAKKAELKLKFANEKLVEAEKLIELKKDPRLIERVLNDFDKKIGEIAKESGENLKQFSEKLIHQQILHQKILERLEEEVQPEVLEKIRKIRENHLEKFAQIMQKVEERKNIAEKIEEELKKIKKSEFLEQKDLEFLDKIKEKMPEDVKEKIEERKEEIIEKINFEKNSLVGLLKECKWTMENVCERKVGKCYCLEINGECKILCATKEQKEKLKDLVGEKVILFGVNENVVSTKKCPCQIEYQEEVCPMVFDPVCGKDGKTYTNECFAKIAGVEIDHKGDCEEKECQTDTDCPQPGCGPVGTRSIGLSAKCIEGKCQIVPVETPTCKNLCGDGICQRIVCMAIGCPCPETPETCPEDCGTCEPCREFMTLEPELEERLRAECEARGGRWVAEPDECGCYGPPGCKMP